MTHNQSQPDRRDVLRLIAGTSFTVPFSALAQAASLPVIGYLTPIKPTVEHIAAFRLGLADFGYVEGRDVTLEFHISGGNYGRLPALAADLVRRQVAVIAAQSPPAALAAKAATSTLPIVFAVGFDPVKARLVASLARPGGNATGVALLSWALGAKRMELLVELVPKAAQLAILLNPNSEDSEPELGEVHAVAQAQGRQVHIEYASNEREIETAFGAFAERRIGGLLVGTDAYFVSAAHPIVAHVARIGVLAVYPFFDFISAGGLICLRPDIVVARRQMGAYAARIIKGEMPSQLPVLQPTTFKLVVNLKSAKAHGVRIPDSILLRADEVIE